MTTLLTKMQMQTAGIVMLPCTNTIIIFFILHLKELSYCYLSSGAFLKAVLGYCAIQNI